MDTPRTGRIQGIRVNGREHFLVRIDNGPVRDLRRYPLEVLVAGQRVRVAFTGGEWNWQ